MLHDVEKHFAQIPRRAAGLVSLEDVFAFVAPQIRDAAQAVARQLESLQVRYALAGGLAVGAHGYVRATKDVDFLVGEEAFEHRGMLVTFKAGVPIQVGTVSIDYLSGTALGLPVDDILKNPPRSDGMPVVPIEVLVQMKLIARRRQDQLDVVELLKAGANARALRAYLGQQAPDLLPLFEELALEA